MILFIFEGASYEPPLYEGIKSLFFPKSDKQVLCSFCSSIYTFYKRLKDEFDGFADVVDVLKMELAKTDPQNELFKYKSADFESIYLFFDYDFYRGNLDVKNAQIKELLEYFNEETDYGRLFISYPMIESIQYTKELPDSNFHQYIVKRADSIGEKFKKEARQFCFYRGYAFLKDTDNWMHIVKQNVIIRHFTHPEIRIVISYDTALKQCIPDAFRLKPIKDTLPLYIHKNIFPKDSICVHAPLRSELLIYIC